MDGDDPPCDVHREGDGHAFGVAHGTKIGPDVVTFRASLGKRRERPAFGDDASDMGVGAGFAAIGRDVAIQSVELPFRTGREDNSVSSLAWPWPRLILLSSSKINAASDLKV